MNDILQNFQDQVMTPDRLLIAITAFLIVTIIGMVRGPLGGHATPFFWHLLDITFGKLGERMDKAVRPKGDLIFRGFLFTSFILLVAFAVGYGLQYLAVLYPTWSLIEILALGALLTSGAVLAGVGRLYRALNDKKVTQGAYFTIARSTRTNLRTL